MLVLMAGLANACVHAEVGAELMHLILTLTCSGCVSVCTKFHNYANCLCFCAICSLQSSPLLRLQSTGAVAVDLSMPLEGLCRDKRPFQLLEPDIHTR